MALLPQLGCARGFPGHERPPPAAARLRYTTGKADFVFLCVSKKPAHELTAYVSACTHQLPYLELEKLNGIEEVKQYLHKKLLEVPL